MPKEKIKKGQKVHDSKIIKLQKLKQRGLKRIFKLRIQFLIFLNCLTFIVLSRFFFHLQNPNYRKECFCMKVHKTQLQNSPHFKAFFSSC